MTRRAWPIISTFATLCAACHVGLSAARNSPAPEQPASSAPQPAQPAAPAAVDDRPECQNCGTSAHMELIEFTDRETGERKSRWKCQQCQAWHWPDRKPGRKTARSRG